jgi:hypothetical protein
MFRKDSGERSPMAINELVCDVVSTVLGELKDRQVSLALELAIRGEELDVRRTPHHHRCRGTIDAAVLRSSNRVSSEMPDLPQGNEMPNPILQRPMLNSRTANTIGQY